ncbi:MAG: class SAM-dependent methyltransferase [Solimicrobium sp.]|jgi:ubiquinone/menaquinone biosynthesis C-methylase UbiE|nr:class SAM-dependent methyltransferase [Solimicrobium sp.]
MNTNLQNYYIHCAEHYEEMYQRPESQTELAGIAKQLQHLLKNRKVLEVACGTGYWTELYATKANQVLATDSCAAMLAIAKAKQASDRSGTKKIDYQLADAFTEHNGPFDACVAGFWWSHIKRSEQSVFLHTIQKICGSGTVLVIFDQCYVEGTSTPIARTDSGGNTYQIRRLPDESRHEMIVNFPTDSTLRKKLAEYAQNIRIVRGTYYWLLTCVLR